jgi:hypothetical protein
MSRGNRKFLLTNLQAQIRGVTTSATTAEVGSCQSEWQIKEEQIKALHEKTAKAH